MRTNLIKSPDADFGDPLRADPPVDALPSRYLLLASLFVVCFALRAWMAWRWNILWSDSIFYLDVTKALEKGDFDTAFRSLGLNTFPAVLLWLRKTGLDWTIAGEWWSVLMASLAVLPLFGWVRRQFDDRVALFACLLYAVQPKLVGYAPLIIRDPTYWFLFNLFLYFNWRAVTELRWWLFLASGVALTLTVYTRIEGCLFLIPLFGWACCRWLAAPTARRRLALGTASSLAMIPLLVVVVNVTCLTGHTKWEFGRMGALREAWSWVVSGVDAITCGSAAAEPLGSSPAAIDDGRQKPPTVSVQSGKAKSAKQKASGPPVASELSLLRVGRKVVIRIVKAMTYGFVTLLVVGLWCWRRVFFRPDQQVLFLHNVALTGCTCFYYHGHGGIDIRYFFSMIVISLPYMALGLLQIAEWIVAPRKHPVDALPARRRWALAGSLAAVTLIGLPDATLTSTPVMLQQTELGQWLRDRQYASEAVLAPSSCLNLLAYHAQARGIPFPKNFDGNGERLDKMIAQYHPGVVVLWEDIYNPVLYNARESIIADCQRHGYRLVPREQLPASCSHVEVLVAGPDAPRTAEKPKPKADARRS